MSHRCGGSSTEWGSTVLCDAEATCAFVEAKSGALLRCEEHAKAYLSASLKVPGLEYVKMTLEEFELWRVHND